MTLVPAAVFLLMPAASRAQSDDARTTISPETGEVTVSPYHQERERREAAGRREQLRMVVAVPDSAQEIAAETSEAAHATGGQNKAKVKPPQPVDATPSVLGSVFLLTAWLLLVTLLALRKFAPGFLGRLNQKLPARFQTPESVPVESESVPEKRAVDEEGVTAFFTAFQAGPRAETESSPHAPAIFQPAFSDGPERDVSPVERRDIQESSDRLERMLVTQRGLLHEINRASDPDGRRKLLAALRWEMHALKGEAGTPRLLPLWQTASALEALVNHLTNKAGSVTASTLRTVTGALELLELLCRSSVDPSLLTLQPVSILVVDGKPAGQDAMTRALKRAFNPPDAASDAADALIMAGLNSYDVIFFDVRSARMSGQEFCSGVRGTLANRDTPVVFVADERDSDALASSGLVAGGDLLGKPFLTFEVTLKALTVALRGRLAASGTVLA